MKTIAATISLFLALSAPAAVHAQSATAKVATTPQNLWLDLRRDNKFMPPEGKAQIIATNPYLTPDNFFFASVSDMDCLGDGGLLVSGEAWNRGQYTPVNWWRIEPDGAISALGFRSSVAGTNAPLAYRFSVAPDGSLVSTTRETVYRVRGNAAQFLAGQNEVEGFKDGLRGAALFKSPRAPIADDSGNVWVSDQEGCALRRVDPAGKVTTVIGRDRSTCNTTLPVDQRITLGSIAWDHVNGEIVAGGSTITGRPHDLHTMVWRIKPDGEARRVYYTVKAGRSPIGQNVDHVYAIAVDAKGQITVASRQVGGRARRQMMRVDEAKARLIPLTGQALTADDMRPGHEEAPYDGPAAKANFREAKRMCYAPDGSLYVLDEHLVRRLTPTGLVRTWAY